MDNIIETGYYWVLLHPIFEDSWTIGYHDENGWFLINLEGVQKDYVIDEVGDKIQEPPEKINYT